MATVRPWGPMFSTDAKRGEAKRKPGRPKGSGFGLINLLRLRVTAQELADLQWLAKDASLTTSAYVRRLIDQDTSRLH